MWREDHSCVNKAISELSTGLYKGHVKALFGCMTFAYLYCIRTSFAHVFEETERNNDFCYAATD